MKELIISILMVALSSLNIFAQPPLPEEGYKWMLNEDLSDEFNGKSLDLNKWKNTDPGRWIGRAPGLFKESSVSMGDGKMRITTDILPEPEVHKGQEFTHRGGQVMSKKKVKPGSYIEARMKANKTFMSSTFWLINYSNEESNCDRRTTELDIQECIGYPADKPQTQRMSSNTHSRGISESCTHIESGSVGAKHELPGKAYDNYYTYGVWWKSPTELRFYLDGEYVYTIEPKADFSLDMYIKLVCETYNWSPVPADGGMTGSWDERTTFYDWVRTYSYVPDDEKYDNVDLSFLNKDLSFDERINILVSQMTLEEKIGQMINGADSIPRLHISDYDWWSEALHGVARNGEATIFPQAIGLGATFDPDLIEKVADAISTEARAKYAISQRVGNHSKYAGLTFWSPTVNIFRDPRYGRGQESYGEDPYLMSRIGVAFVNGLQGRHPKYLKVAACAKHFALHSGPEHNKLEFDISPSKQDLYETYLPAFEALVTEAKVEGVMAAYNSVYGQPSATNSFLLKKTLRDKWMFDGYITSDCGAIRGVSGKQGFIDTPVEAAALALKAGTNLNCGSTYRLLKNALEQGLVTEELIDERLKQLFKTKFRLGIFDADQSENPYNSISPNKIHCDEHISLAREVAQKSIVLLKNKNNVLPLSPQTKVPYLTGPFANSNDMLMGSYYGVSTNLVSILEGVTAALAPGTSLNYRSGALPFHENINPKNFAPNVAAQSDVTICVVGTTADMEGEGVDAIASNNGGDRKDLKLPDNQINYIHQLVEKKKGPLILIIASGGPISLEGIEEHCDAILQIWYPGEQGGNAVADVLFGRVSPSGHLPITFPKNVDQLPSYDSYSMEGRTYKYMKEEPLYPFGFGLTYSSTEINNLSLSSSKLNKNETLIVEVDIANTGSFDIEDVLQLYISPENLSDGLPLRSLKAFKRVKLTKESKETIAFSIKGDDLKVINPKGEKEWRKGEYTITIGNSSPGERSIKLGAAKPQTATLILK